MIYRATNIIAKAFEEFDVDYEIAEVEDASAVEVHFGIEGGPRTVVRFISEDDDNDVAIRVFGLVTQIPLTKRSAMMEACNTINEKVRYFKFLLTSDSKINVEADLPVRTEDECIGLCCVELYVKIMRILDDEYHILAETLGENKNTNTNTPLDILRTLKELRETPISQKRDTV